ncbi:MAG TPA: gamma-glutamyl-gamma-aminobutyrate hydrolase family protein [Bryobacteraceae bacterium]|nr:gamma-glutamyl-gamma-aminobutyrate hydrolase family protein [Bryobacteraceae bacterium]
MTRRQAGLTFRFPNKAAPYADALRLAGIEPVLISPENPRPLHGLQGLLLSGGTDLDPARYGAAALPGNEHPDNQRDVLESGLLADALAADLPVLAICRGMQLFNVFHGGTLVQHLDNADFHRVRGGHPELPVHQILVEPGTRLAAILGAGRHGVNSRHHQAVDRIGGGLLVTARSIPDGVVEALERADRRFALAVQWHPEDQIVHDQPQLNLFEAFAEALG